MDQSKDVVTVIVPVYNAQQYISDCIESILRQTYQNLEIILVDDGSSDQSKDLCNHYSRMDSRIRVIHQVNQGVAAARNMGIRNASGTYAVFVDADDYIDPDSVEYLMQYQHFDLVSCSFYKNFDETDEKIVDVMAGCAYADTDEKKQQLQHGSSLIPGCAYADVQHMSELKKKMMYSSDQVFNDLLASMCNKLFRLDIVRSFYEDLNTDIAYEEDAAFVYTYILKCSSAVICERAYYHYRIHKDSAVHSNYRYFLKNVNDLYIYLETLFQNDAEYESLLYQLQRWIVELSLYGLNEKMNFMEQVKVPSYALPFEEQIRNKDVILYGAGKIGRDYYRSMCRKGMRIRAWVDKSFAERSGNDLPIESPERLSAVDYDYILLAVKEEKMSQGIQRDLVKKGVEESKILWKVPSLFF